MKYKVGDKTLFGEITDTDKKDSRYPYRVEFALQALWLTESEIDKIIIKPKRNIDHIIELLEDGKEEAARKFYNDLVPLSEGYAVADEIYYFLKPYTEPSTYPKLYPDEIRAVKWLVDGGFTHIDTQFAIYTNGCSSSYYDLSGFPTTKCLKRCGQPQGTAIPLKELLDAQEEPSPYDQVMKDFKDRGERRGES